MSFLRRARLIISAFVIAWTVLGGAQAPSVGAFSASEHALANVETTTNFVLHWQAIPEATHYQVRASHDRVLLQNDQVDSVLYSNWLEANELLLTSIGEIDDGEWFWQVRGQNATGVMTDWSEVRQVMVDTTGPAISLFKPEMALYGLGRSGGIDLHVKVADTCSDDRCHIRLDGRDITQELQVIREGDSTLFMGAIMVGALSDDKHRIGVTARDIYGNTTEQAREFTVDNTAPAVETLLEDGRHIRGIVPLDFVVQDAHAVTYQLDILKNGTPLDEKEAGLSEALRKDKGGASYSWNTAELTKGAYQLIFTAVDEAGNKATITRTVEVVPSFLSLMGAEATDPLLEQISARLSQPFVEATVPEAAPVVTGSAAESVNDSLNVQPDERTLAEKRAVSVPVLVVPSEDGWRIFGILWYWWFCIMAGGVVAYRRWRPVQAVPA